MATSQSPTEPTPIDHLSSLPDALLVTILSFLPTEIAARTSVLSRRFQHLWKASPAVDLAFHKFKFQSFEAVANGALLSRQPSNPLLRLHLNVTSLIYSTFISSLLTHAHSLGLRHLTLNGDILQADDEDIQSIVRTVFFISSLESLSISLDAFSIVLPSATSLTHLKSLFITPPVISAQVERLLLELCCLDHLRLSELIQSSAAMVNLSSSTVKRLELFAICPFGQETCSVGLLMPSLEFLFLSQRSSWPLPCIRADIPLLRKSVIKLPLLRHRHVTAVAQLLNSITHVEELSLDLNESEGYPFCNLLEPGKEAPVFPNLKHLDAHMCFHELNFEAAVSLLCRSPALQSLKLVHKDADEFTLWTSEKRKMYDWRSKLPRNVNGNRQHAYFSNLHLKENNKGFMKLLNKSSTGKKMKAHN
ncbi:F-box/RNI-like/FBD-like domains-containing protein [Rhynchospora pubera]|uniref:F-box/RNI-like/FBD-like domains-containing protein n=1 Tax=Rhynchospora pubera TaxID=906938 RepID=A0AAV8EKF5_9POAL|nr:F-box/RNI-like/FBD-like domains-containing protein [Rhynchospora pubera]